MPRVKRSQAEADQVESAGSEFLEALARGLRVIQAFDRDRRQLSLSDAARLVDLPRASVRRTLHTLVQLGFAETDGRMFRLTPRILSLAGAYLLSNSVSTILQPAVDRLSAELSEACSAAVLDGDDVVMIAHASPARMLALGAQVGYRLPAASTSLGRVLLAALDDRELDRFFARARLEKRTPFTLVDKAELERAVVKAREEGFSLVDQEAELGFRSISVPLRRIDGKVVAALNVGVHSERVTLDAMLDGYLPRLRAAASELQPQLI
ncbi:IclR family transcriptional regulator C-terminal domain-containing protein [Pseudorhodoplanes sp.]|uniref:IclR family transcriptional regulator domain-containing protein n=1 Tax=Pseudorhodoplanes sp. TaxID=1934341 RepID=UPI003919E586